MQASEVAAQKDRAIWLSDPGTWRYRADPFGLTREGSTHVFVEAFDYRTKHAVIEHHRLNPVAVDRSGARPGGTPLIADDGLAVLPVQDCSRTYGGGARGS